MIGAISASVACAGVVAGAAVQLLVPGEQPAAATVSAPSVPAQQPAQPPALNQHGRLIAVSPDSVTARSADGVVQTYRVTPDTTALTLGGNHTVSPATTFSVDDEVAIAGVMQNGTPVATTVADRQVSGLDGPPMDSLAVQPASQHSGTVTAG